MISENIQLIDPISKHIEKIVQNDANFKDHSFKTINRKICLKKIN